MARTGRYERGTKETHVLVEIDLDGGGKADISTPLPFLSHMLDQVARHGLFDLRVSATGDVHIDGHHTTEDVGLALGKAVADALGDRRGIRRYGEATLPMDEALVQVALDLSGRPFFVNRIRLPKGKIGEFDAELCPVFLEAFARGAGCNLHARLFEGENLHHMVEVTFKAFTRALADATRIDPRIPGVPSTKGALDT